MFCKKCGAVVTGKYCSCCGERIRSYGQDFFLALKRRRRVFINARYGQVQSFMALHVAEFCWDTVQRLMVEPLRGQILSNSGADIDGEALLDAVEERTNILYTQVYGLIQHGGIK